MKDTREIVAAWKCNVKHLRTGEYDLSKVQTIMWRILSNSQYFASCTVPDKIQYERTWPTKCRSIRNRQSETCGVIPWIYVEVSNRVMSASLMDLTIQTNCQHRISSGHVVRCNRSKGQVCQLANSASQGESVRSLYFSTIVVLYAISNIVFSVL